MNGHGMRVLVFEDNADVGTFAAQTLRDLGYEAILTYGAEDALVELARNAKRFDVVFFDVA